MRGTGKALALGLLTFALLFALGEATAADQPTATDSDNTLGATVQSNAPEITGFDITDAADTSFMHAQIDVVTTFYFNVTLGDDNGWEDIQAAEIHIWYDGGSSEQSFSAQTTGANYRAVLNYTNAGDLTVPALNEWNVTEGNIAYDSADSSLFVNTANQNYTFKLSFQANAQMRQADDPVNTGTAGYDDLGSWNAEVVAWDSQVSTTNQKNATGVYHEFGIFQYTTVTIASNWDAGTIEPGLSGTTSAVGVTHQSNRAYDLKVWFDTHLEDGGGNSIDVSNINITAGGDTADDILSDTSFGGLTETNAVIIRNDTSNGTHETATNDTTTNVQFRVFVPFGTPSGSYTANLTIKVEQP